MKMRIKSKNKPTYQCSKKINPNPKKSTPNLLKIISLSVNNKSNFKSKKTSPYQHLHVSMSFKKLTQHGNLLIQIFLLLQLTFDQEFCHSKLNLLMTVIGRVSNSLSQEKLVHLCSYSLLWMNIKRNCKI